MKKRLYIFFVPFCILCMSYNDALADYDCYVDSNCKNQGLGTEKQPFNKLSQATNTDGCNNIFYIVI